MRDGEAVGFEQLVRTYRTPTGEVPALRGVSGSLPRGMVSAVVGPSGSGKSSLLRVIAGLDRPSAGRVVVDGHEIGGASARTRRRLLRDVVGYVYQRPAANFLADMTVGEHLRLAAGPGGTPDDLEALLDALGIAQRADHLPQELSGGEQQRAAFAQALATGARIVVADEPTAELDTVSGAHVLERVRALTAAGITVVLATHDPDVIATADAILELDHGRVGRIPAPGHLMALDDPPSVPLIWPGHEVPLWLTDGPAADPEGVVHLSGVSKTYGGGDEQVHALRDVDLQARAGEIVGIVGRSGSGKTTLLNVIAGWEEPDDGAIRAPGGGAPGWSDIAFLPQRLGLMDELSIRENVEYPARLAGDLIERRGLAESLLERLGLAGLARRYPTEVSLGEQQRTALARAVVSGPSLLIADEPTGHQDAGWAERIFGVLAEAAAAGSCCLIATHDAGLTPFLDRTLTMSDGALSGSEEASGGASARW